MLKNISLISSKTIFLISIFFISVYAVFFYSKSAEAITQNKLTGSCGFIITTNHDGWDKALTAQGGMQMVSRAIGMVNFDSNSIAVKMTFVKPYGATTNVSAVVEKLTAPLTLESYDSDTGVYEYKAVNPGNAIEVFHISVLPVNSANTYLTTVYTEAVGFVPAFPGGTGVCQKI